MVAMMPDRSENDIKNKFYSMKRCTERARRLGVTRSCENDLSDSDEVTDDEENPSDHGSFDTAAITTSTGGKDFSLLLSAHHRINSQQK